MKSPRSIAREFNRFFYRRAWRYKRNLKGTNFLEEDWDNLIILDACRYDYFSEYSDLPGKLEYRYSLGSKTKETIRENFKGKELKDIVYLSDNSWFLKLRDKIGAKIHRFIDLNNEGYEVDYAVQDLGVVTPETVTEHAKRIHNDFPNKRLIVHYLQPHHPFLGSTGEKYFSHSSSSLWDVVREADLSSKPEVVRKAYKENLQLVLEEVEELIPHLKGKTVITADHGEMLGERLPYFPVREYGHPRGIYNDILTKVPWNVIDSDERKEIIEEEPEEKEEVDEEELDSRLRNLGYLS